MILFKFVNVHTHWFKLRDLCNWQMETPGIILNNVWRVIGLSLRKWPWLHSCQCAQWNSRNGIATEAQPSKGPRCGDSNAVEKTTEFNRPSSRWWTNLSGKFSYAIFTIDASREGLEWWQACLLIHEQSLWLCLEFKHGNLTAACTLVVFFLTGGWYPIIFGYTWSSTFEYCKLIQGIHETNFYKQWKASNLCLHRAICGLCFHSECFSCSNSNHKQLAADKLQMFWGLELVWKSVKAAFVLHTIHMKRHPHMSAPHPT